MLNVTLVGERELVARLGAMPGKLQASLLRKVSELALRLEAKVKREKLMGQVLKHRSGRLLRSIQHKVEQSPGAVTGKVYSSGDVKYAGIHEYGGKTPPHVIEAKNAKALVFMRAGKAVFYQRVNHPGSVMPERSYLRSTLREMKPEIVSGLEKTVKETLRG